MCQDAVSLPPHGPRAKTAPSRYLHYHRRNADDALFGLSQETINQALGPVKEENNDPRPLIGSLLPLSVTTEGRADKAPPSVVPVRCLHRPWHPYLSVHTSNSPHPALISVQPPSQPCCSMQRNVSMKPQRAIRPKCLSSMSLLCLCWSVSFPSLGSDSVKLPLNSP